MTNPESGSGPETSRDHSALHRSYGEALVQISELEDAVANLGSSRVVRPQSLRAPYRSKAGTGRRVKH